MTSTTPPKERFLAEPVEITTRSNRRRPSDHSNASPAPSDISESTDASMAVLTSSPPSAPVDNLHKTKTQHVEHTSTVDVEMTMEDSTTNGLTQSKPVDDRKMWGDVSQQPAEQKPKRRFAPQPVETSTRSSKQEQAPKRTVSPKRKFVPEPVETTTRSSKSENVKEDDKPARPRRKFAVEPIDTKVTSSKDRAKRTEDNDTKPKRRFAPEPMETTTRSSKDKEQDDKPTKPRRKFAVEPLETSSSSSSNRRKKDESGGGKDSNVDFPSRSSSGARKFSPELIQTAKASYRKKPSTPPRRLSPEREEEEGAWSAPEPTESRFSAANLAKKARADPRRHSYSIPDLPIIQSDSSGEESSAPVTPGGLHQIPTHDRAPHDWHARPKHHHQHNSAAHLAEMKTLREQAVAAYGDQEDIIPFAHYGGDSEDEDYTHVGELSIQDGADPSLFRRMSHSDLHLVVEELRNHHEQLDRAKRELHEDTCGVSRFSAAALAARHHLGIHHPTTGHLEAIQENEKKQEPKKEDPEFAQMRKAASPPMQGDEIKFPFSISPKMTRCDPDQAPRPRRRNSEEDEDHDIGSEELWSAHITVNKSPASAGLWGGLCQRDENAPVRPTTPLRSGIQTPAYEASNPFEPRTPGRGTRTPGARTPGTKTPGRGGGQLWGSAFMPLTPPRSRNEKTIDTFAVALDAKLTLERQIDTEFHPRVITQIYNYLSLGYPPLARPFDEELSKISRISIAELRKGDRSQTGTMKGHIGVPEGEGEGEEDDEGRVKGCRRWEALRLYVREWARQSSNFADEHSLKNVGTGMWGNNAPVRKGSWGF